MCVCSFSADVTDTVIIKCLILMTTGKCEDSVTGAAELAPRLRTLKALTEIQDSFSYRFQMPISETLGLCEVN